LDALSEEEENAYKKMKLLRYSIEDVSDLQAAFARAGNAIKDILNKKLSGEYDVDTLQSELKLELCIEENLDTYTIPELDPTVAEASLRFLCSQKSVDYDDIHGYVLENEDYYNGEPELLYLAYRVARDTGRQDCVDRFIEDYLEEITGSYVIYCDTPGCEFKREFWVFGFITLARSGWIKNPLICKILFIIGLLPVAAILLFWLLPFAIVFLAPLGAIYLIFMIVMNLIDLHQQKKNNEDR